ncbi:hypothetical protein FO519_001398 [Halicephalobus sp. NKZ332]|nr:hypothetical protein FO519_001398 [Halicephalobus sp. NKZ332]
MKQHISNAPDCKQLCAALTDFTCTAFLWPAEGGDCYLYDTINLEQEIFRDPMDSYVLYVQVCGDASPPSVGYCEFQLEQQGVTGAPGSISPGIAALSSCNEFCIAKYQGPNCNAYIVSSDANMLSTCLLYTTPPSNLQPGNVDLYVKNCAPPPLSCQYTPWSSWGSCSSSCTQERTRSVRSQPTTGGAPCMDTEMTDSLSCTESPCVPPNNDPEPTTCQDSDFSSWTSWTTCDSQCTQQSSRTLQNENCDLNGAPLTTSQVCEGGDCNSDPETDPQDDDSNPNGNQGNIPEVGCRIDSVDPRTQPSSAGFKAVGAQQDCAARCVAETSFSCEAYVTTGPGGPCVLHGPIDRVVEVLVMSSWYLQDINCVVNTSAATSLCGWQLVRTSISPLETTASQWTSLGYAINADHCGTLCMMNHPLYKPNPCEAYAYSTSTSWTGPEDNCYMYTPIDEPWSFDSTGNFDLYKQVCYANKSSVASASAPKN